MFYLALLVDPLIMASVKLEQPLMLFPIDLILVINDELEYSQLEDANMIIMIAAKSL
jgi:hypothetical protein